MKGFYPKCQRIVSILVISCLFTWFATQKIHAQNPVIEDIIEELANNSSTEDEDYSSVIEDLSFYLENPLNLNEANVETLEKLRFLSEFQIENLLNYVASKGEMKTIFELQLIDGFDIETINKMLPFVKVAIPESQKQPKFKEIIKFGNNRLAAETRFVIQEQAGYISEDDQDTTVENATKYQGDRMKYLLRYRFNYKTKIFAGITAEKDPGEQFDFGNNKYGFDYYSFHLQAYDIGIIKTIVVGDYQAKFGQGLILWTGFGLGKSTDAINIRKKSQALRYYSSTDENNFLRGAASTMKFGKLEYTAFVSYKRIDANLIESDTLEQTEERINSFQNTGYHRTTTEIKNRKAINESIFGSKIGIGLENFKAGLNFVAYHYNVTPNQSDIPYKLFEFSEKTNFNISADYTYFAKKFTVFGEFAIAKNGSIATLNGLVTKVVPQLSFSLLHRYYQKDYQAYYASSFAENSKISNEQGLYYGLVYHPFRKLKISAYADAFQFAWLKYGIDAPSQGNEYFIQTDYTVNRNLSMYFRWRNGNKEGNLSGDNGIMNSVVNENKQNFRYHISYRISPLIGLRNRVEFVKYNKNGNNEYGFMILQDVNIDLNRIPLSIDLRYSIFDATYESRIFAYENDLLYNFSIPAYSGKGNRFYLLIKYQFGRRFDLRVRYSQFLYVDKQTIGTGLDEIEGNLKSEIKVQFVIHL